MRTKDSRLHRPFFFLALLLLMSCSGSALVLSPVEGQVVYVDCNAPGPEHDGNTWDTAYLTIQEGVDDADTLNEQVWVADGTYVENVALGKGVEMYGGFLGAEPGGYETDLDQRDFINNVTTIDGSQSGSVVVPAGGGAIDGFTLTNGTGTDVSGALCGGGIYCFDCSPGIANNRLISNTAMYGGGIYCKFASPEIAGNAILDNEATAHGGGVYCTSALPSLSRNRIAYNTSPAGGGIYCGNGSSGTISENLIEHNSAASGGGIACSSSSPPITSNWIRDNEASNVGGGIHSTSSSPPITANDIAHNFASSGAGVYLLRGEATCVGNVVRDNRATSSGAAFYVDADVYHANNLIAGNWAGGEGGAVYCVGSGYYSYPYLTNETIVANSATSGGGVAVSTGYVTLKAYNCAVVFNSAGLGGGFYRSGGSMEIMYCDVFGNTGGDYYDCSGYNCISEDPLFVDAEGGDYHLSADSPCIDAGYNHADLPAADWEAETRTFNETADIGADEFVPLLATAPDPAPYSQGALFGGSAEGYPAWVWFSIPVTPDACCPEDNCYNPSTLLGFECDGRLWYWDKYVKAPQVYQPPFTEWDLAVGDGYLLYLASEVATPEYVGVNPYLPHTFEFKLGRMGWTWVGLPGLTELDGEFFMHNVKVKYPSDDAGSYRTARQDYDAAPDSWISWGWSFYDTWGACPKAFVPYAPFGCNTCCPWLGYRVWVEIGTAMEEDDPDQVTLIWP